MHPVPAPRPVRVEYPRRGPSAALRCLGCAVLLTALAGADLAGAQLEAVGEPQLVDQVASGPLYLAVDARGRSALVWEKRLTTWLAMAMFDENGDLAGEPFRFRDRARSIELMTPASIAADGSGQFLVAWDGFRNGVGPRSPTLVLRARFFDVRGKALSPQFDLETTVAPVNLFAEHVDRNRQGDAVVIWERSSPREREIRARRFDRRNQPVGGNLTLLRDAEGYGHRVALDERGRFVVTWGQVGESGQTHFFQRFRRDGKKLGGKRPVIRGARSGMAAVAREPTGEIAIAWRKNGIRARFYDEFGRPMTGVVDVSGPAPESDAETPALARDRFGNAVIVWAEGRPSTTSRIRARVFDRSGHALGEAVELALGGDPSVGIADDGLVIVSWQQVVIPHRFATVQRFRITCAPGYEDRCPEP